MKKYLVEFIGTFFLVLTIIMAVNTGLESFAPLAIGAILIVLVYSGFHVSGAHYSPAVTLAVWLRGKMDSAEIPGYVIAQLVGATVAGFVAQYFLQHVDGGTTITIGNKFEFYGGMLAEFLGTFVLVWVILHVGTAKAIEGNQFYGIAIGFTVMGCIYALGGVSGGMFNPAVATSLCLVGMSPWSNMGGFLIGQILGGVAAAYLFKYVNGPD